MAPKTMYSPVYIYMLLLGMISMYYYCVYKYALLCIMYYHVFQCPPEIAFYILHHDHCRLLPPPILHSHTPDRRSYLYLQTSTFKNVPSNVYLRVVYPTRLTRPNGKPGVVPAGPWEAAAANAFLMILLQPALVLIDHGHFQYNSVCLGLAMAGAVAVASGDRRGGER